MAIPILYSFRRCPYAIRARMALLYSGIPVEIREVVLRNKAPEFLAASPSATVPTLVLDQKILDESFEIMLWAASQSDPDGWLETPDCSADLILEADGPFKDALDRIKYASKYRSDGLSDAQSTAFQFLNKLDIMLSRSYLYGEKPSIADVAIFPFVRQFAFVDKNWFDAQNWSGLQVWLEKFLVSELFLNSMDKYPKWKSGDAVIIFPENKTSDLIR